MRFVHSGFGVLLFGGFLLCSCAGGIAKRRTAPEKQTARSIPEGSSNSTPAWQMRIGRVVLVNSELDFK
jgi:hypothetical protein